MQNAQNSLNTFVPGPEGRGLATCGRVLVTITNVSTGVPAIILASATGGVVSKEGHTKLDAFGNLSVYIDIAQSWSINVEDNQGLVSVPVFAQYDPDLGANTATLVSKVGGVDTAVGNGAASGLTSQQVSGIQALVSGAGIYPAGLDTSGNVSAASANYSILSSAITQALAAKQDIYLPAGVICINQALPDINVSGVTLYGAGSGFFSSTGESASTVIQFTGSAGATMLRVGSVSGAGNNKVVGSGVVGIGFDGNNLAATGVLIESVNQCTFDYSVTGCTTVQTRWGTVASLKDARDCQENVVYAIRVKPVAGAKGIVFDTNTLGANISFNEIQYLRCDGLDGDGITIGNCDNNVFSRVSATGSGGSNGLVFGAADGVTSSPARANVVGMCSVTNGILAQGTTYNTVASNNNMILYLDKENNDPDPVVDTGATLAWGTNHLSMMGGAGNFAWSIGDTSSVVTAQITDTLNTSTPFAIRGVNGKHIRLHNGATGVWGINVAASGGNLNIVRAGSTGTLVLPKFTTAAAPAYTAGGIYFDTTLNKVRIGGASAWETVTSV